MSQLHFTKAIIFYSEAYMWSSWSLSLRLVKAGIVMDEFLSFREFNQKMTKNHWTRMGSTKLNQVVNSTEMTLATNHIVTTENSIWSPWRYFSILNPLNVKFITDCFNLYEYYEIIVLAVSYVFVSKLDWNILI